ncbi:MAG TPA: VWA domain-containing protein [Vicinamibacteria bacterium]|nr:VWA domain-containing protein [Vicinamibacteria bacterium]
MIGPLRVGLLLALLSCGEAALAQAPSPSPSPSASPRAPLRLEVDVDVVSVTAVVHDKAGRFVRGLGPSDIEVLEDGVRQEVSYFRAATGPGAERIPLSVALVLDSSGSMRRNMRFLREAAVTFVNRLEAADTALVVSFNESVKGSAEFSGDVGRLEQFVEALEAWGGTSLYDAIHYGLGRIKDQPGRKAVIVFSDGADTTSSIPEREVIDYARSVEATVYCVGIRGESGLFARSPRGFLRRVAQETGGAYFFPDKVGELIKVFTEISDELHNHYLLAYTPKRPPDGTWREIEVRLPGRKDLEMRVRKGYFAVRRPRPPRSTVSAP